MDERIKLYSIYLEPEFKGDFKTLVNHVEFAHSGADSEPSPLVELIIREYADSFHTSDYKLVSSSINYDRLYYLWSQSKIVSFNCKFYNVSIDKHVQLISLHYDKKDFIHLTHQLQDEELYLSCVPQNDPSYLPYLIDLGFAENLRNLSPVVYDSYCEQFGLESVVDYRESAPYKELYSRSTKWYNDTHKTRAKNEYVMYNPRIQEIQNALKLCQSSVH